MKKIQPYSDAKMLYNETTKQYELKLGWVKNLIGNPFSDDGVLEMRIKRNTRKVYEFIFSRAYSGNRRIITAIIDHTEEYRECIYDALLKQMEADAASGYNDNDLFVADNHEQRVMQQENQVCVGCENILYDSVGYGGINLLYAGCYKANVYLEFMEYLK